MSNSSSTPYLDRLVELTKVFLISLRQEHMSDACSVCCQDLLLDATHLTAVVKDKGRELR